jgi:hypothetical protein
MTSLKPTVLSALHSVEANKTLAPASAIDRCILMIPNPYVDEKSREQRRWRELAARGPRLPSPLAS